MSIYILMWFSFFVSIYSSAMILQKARLSVLIIIVVNVVPTYRECLMPQFEMYSCGLFVNNFVMSCSCCFEPFSFLSLSSEFYTHSKHHTQVIFVCLDHIKRARITLDPLIKNILNNEYALSQYSKPRYYGCGSVSSRYAKHLKWKVDSRCYYAAW